MVILHSAANPPPLAVIAVQTMRAERDRLLIVAIEVDLDGELAERLAWIARVESWEHVARQILPRSVGARSGQPLLQRIDQDEIKRDLGGLAVAEQDVGTEQTGDDAPTGLEPVQFEPDEDQPRTRIE